MQVIDRAIPIDKLQNFFDILRDTDGVLTNNIMRVDDNFVTVSYEPGDVLEMETKLHQIIFNKDSE